MIFIKIIFTIFAMIGILNPKLSWKMSEGWKFKNAEPSSAYLIVTRIMSIVFLVFVWFVMPSGL